MKQKILKKIDELITDCNEVLTLAERFDNNLSLIDYAGEGKAKFRAFRASALSFLANLIGTKEIYYNTFDSSVVYFKTHCLKIAIELLQKIRKDFDDGWLQNLKGLISAEIFSDFLEMAEHLLEENYKDPSAVIIGSVLEENLRELCTRNGIAITSIDLKTNKTKPNKAETMNVDLCKKRVYNILVQKSVTAWLDLRNKAAHGKYGEYDLPQVKNLLHSVRDFTIKYL
jgi:hypothetical protein